jgi:hypothetical protein
MQLLGTESLIIIYLLHIGDVANFAPAHATTQDTRSCRLPFLKKKTYP